MCVISSNIIPYYVFGVKLSSGGDAFDPAESDTIVVIDSGPPSRNYTSSHRTSFSDPSDLEGWQ